MRTMLVPADGGCRCAALRFRLSGAPMLTSACHCRGCQQMTGSDYSLTVTVPEHDFHLLSGEPVAGGLRTATAQHWHCPSCFSWTHSSFLPSQGLVNVRIGALDDPAGFEPFVEFRTAEKLPWVDLPVRHSYPDWPSPDAFGPLLSEYAAR